jgi:hypothetical protein
VDTSAPLGNREASWDLDARSIMLFGLKMNTVELDAVCWLRKPLLYTSVTY